MSVAPAVKNVSEKPPANAVTVPNDPQALQADVQRKMKFYGVIQAFRNGRMPTNAQIDETLSYVRDHPPIDVNKLSPEGRKLTEDTRDIIETARRMVLEKNADELFQEFIFHTSDASVKPQTADAPLTKNDLKQHGSQAVQHLRTLLQLLLTNSESRKLLSDATLIGRDLFAQGAANVAERARPSPEKMANVDDAAPSEQWATAQPLDGDHKGAAAGLKDHLKDTHRDLAESSAAAEQARPDPNVPTTSPLHDPAAPIKAAAPGAVATVDRATEPESPASSSDPALPTKKTFKSRFQAMTGKVPQEHRERATAEVQAVKNSLKEQFPKERRDQFIYRLKKVVVECQQHPSYKASLEWFLDVLEQYFSHAKNAAKDQHGHNASLFQNDPVLQQATNELRTLAERFANNKSLDDIINAVQRLWQDAREDEQLRDWWKRVDKTFRKTLLEPGFILQPQCNSEWRTIRDDSHRFFDEKYKGHKDALFDTVSTWFKAFGEDPLNKRFGDDWGRLTKNLLFDENGNLTYKAHLWNDVRTVIMPELARQVGYVPIPRIEYTDKALDLVIENLTLQGRNLFPNVVEFQAQNYFKMSPYGSIKDEQHHTINLNMTQIQADLRDVAFYYHKKTGFPKIRDQGLADVFLGGQGISVKVKIASTSNDPTSVFKVKDVSVKVDALKFAIKDAKHNFLYKTLRPLATGLIKKQIAKAIGDGIRTGLEVVDAHLVKVREQMAQAGESDTASRTEVLKQLFTKKTEDAESKVSSVKSKRESKFKIVPRRESMLLPDQGHESGWSRIQYEKEELAKQGDGWRSNAFSIVPKSGTNPAPTAPTQKTAAA
ncbi:hypothetical protein AURDEDRAFT_153456 [Auricularia subglabra TFB-10046 SS5]|uniref:Uncharacterized protein n=1 Tax=Auricularia subglabra (strain TFB-10046 / SS5) TaxID=717982 RepID=J0LJV0_AURST|nr:hypothetical protein AURDEDRAFT_153456 [Auricularia subglabra TFB-10046 SS5]